MTSPTVTLEAFAGDGVTSLGDLDLASDVDVLTGERQDGHGQATLPFSSAQAALLAADAPRIVRVTVGATDWFDWYVQKGDRRLDTESGGTITFTGPGLRHVLRGSQVRPYGDCRPTSQVMPRNLGFADPSYDASALPAAVSLGRWRDQATLFGAGADTRAPEFPDPLAHFIWSETGPPTPVGTVIAYSPTFTVDTRGYYVLSLQVDEEYEVYIIGEQVGQGTGVFRWRTGYDSYLLELCTGITYRLVIVGRNIERPVQATNIGWIIATLGAASADGKPAASSEVSSIVTDGSAGTFTVRPMFVESQHAATVDVTDDAATVETKLQAAVDTALAGATVTVSGSAGDWEVTWGGTLASTDIGTLAVDGAGLADGTVTATRVVEGGQSSWVIHTDDSWVVNAYPTSPPGLNAFELIDLAISEAQARGDTLLDHITYGTMDATVDARGDAWGFEINMEVSPYLTTVGDVLDFIELQGYDCWFEPGWVLQIAQERTTTPYNTVDLSTVKAGRRSTWKLDKPIANVLSSPSKDGWVTREDDPSIAVHGRWEDTYSTPDGSEVTVTGWQQKALNDSKDPYREDTIYWSADDPDAPALLTEVDWGDIVTGETITGGTTDYRVAAVGLTVANANGAVEYRAQVVQQ